VRLSGSTIEQLKKLKGLTPTVSDVLDELGLSLTVPASVLVPRQSPSLPVIGHAVTSAYLPRRSRTLTADVVLEDGTAPKPLFDPGHQRASPGDVLVLSARAFRLPQCSAVVSLPSQGRRASPALSSMAASATLTKYKR
jgi:hypothetical protein